MIERLEVPDAAAMHDLGLRLGRGLRAGDLVVLTGPLGAGKTTLTAGIGEGLGVRGPISSPTFVLARTHPSVAGGPPLVHVDAYRLSSPAELDDLDLDFERSVVVVEWGAGMVDGIADSVLEIRIARAADDVRSVELTGTGPRWAACRRGMDERDPARLVRPSAADAVAGAAASAAHARTSGRGPARS